MLFNYSSIRTLRMKASREEILIMPRDVFNKVSSSKYSKVIYSPLKIQKLLSYFNQFLRSFVQTFRRIFSLLTQRALKAHADTSSHYFRSIESSCDFPTVRCIFRNLFQSLNFVPIKRKKIRVFTFYGSTNVS